MQETEVVRIEQRLQDPARFLMLPIDEAAILGLPLLMGLLSRQLVIGAPVAFIIWAAWRYIKGNGGIEYVLAAAYWFIPSRLSVFRPLPPSSVERWEA